MTKVSKHVARSAAVLATTALLLVGCGRGEDGPSTRVEVGASASREPPKDSITVLTEGEARELQATFYADRYGIPIEEAVRRMEQQEEAGVLSPKIEADVGDRFAGAWLDNQTDYMHLVIRLTGDEPPLAEAATLARGSEVEVRFELGSPLTYGELKDRAGEAGREAFEIFDLAGFGTDVPGFGVLIHIQPGSPNIDRLAEVEADLEAHCGINVTLEVLNERAGDD